MDIEPKNDQTFLYNISHLSWNFPKKNLTDLVNMFKKHLYIFLEL